MASYRSVAYGALADTVPQKADDAHTLMQAWFKNHIFLYLRSCNFPSDLDYLGITNVIPILFRLHWK